MGVQMNAVKVSAHVARLSGNFILKSRRQWRYGFSGESAADGRVEEEGVAGQRCTPTR